MAYSEEEKKEELKRLSDFLDSVEIAAQVLGSSLLISLPSVEDMTDMTEEEAAEKLHLAAGNLAEEEPEVVKYLSLYTQVKEDLEGLDELTVLRLVNQMNHYVRVGHFYYDEVETGEWMVQYRASVMGAAGEDLDEGVVANTILEMGIGYDRMKDALKDLKEGIGSGG